MIRKPTFGEAMVPMLAMVLLLGLGYGKYGLPIQALLIIASAIAGVIAKRVGYTWKDMAVSATKSTAVFHPFW